MNNNLPIFHSDDDETMMILTTIMIMILITAVLMIVNVALVFFIQPVSRYYYEQMEYELRSGALGASIKVGEFTTLADRGPSQAMLNLQWHHTANLIGKKVLED